ncbi:MAG TPA: YcaO-like family protein [Candidatus Angelobacter sp.]|nr:YcaO-like family protein [Candidatus Angelobacter sp.]
MQTKTQTLSFGKRLLAPSAAPLRETLLRLTEPSLDREIYVDSFLGMYLDDHLKWESWDSFLIFDFHRIYLYENSSVPEGPKIGSVLRWLRDDYRVDIKHLAAYGQEQFDFFYPVEALEIVASFWRDCPSGTLITFDLTNGEIRKTKAFVHPKSKPPLIRHSERDCLIEAERIPPLQDRFSERHLRIGQGPELSDLLSPDIGLIRQEDAVASQLAFPVVLTQLAGGHDKRIFCGGKGRRIAGAAITARCEVLERFCASFVDPKAHLIYGSYEMFSTTAVDPQSLCFRLPRPDPAGVRIPYASDVSMYWCTAQDLQTGKTHLVPAQEVWFTTYSLPGENLCIRSSSNGCAVGGTFEEAALFSILELIERDAFLTAWYLRRSCRKIHPESITLEEFQLVWCRACHTYRNYAIHLFDLTSDLGLPVVLCVAVRQHGKGPKVMLSAACRLHCDEAALSALKDMATMPDVRFHDESKARELLAHPEAVVSPEDHAAYYFAEENFGRVSFLDFDARPVLTAKDVDRNSLVPRQDRYNLKQIIATIAGHLSELGLNVLVKDLTHREFADRNLFCLRTIIPGLYPMWFGYYSVRLNITDRLRHLSQKFTGQILKDESQLNLDIHPFD